jgi:3-phenylpropionate/trans-cinnamate dioxygenase ferredoxin reductase subunit
VTVLTVEVEINFPRSKNMRTVPYLIVGGGVAGTTAAETIRQHDATGSIAIVSDEPYRLYSRIILSKPNFFLGKLPFDSVWLKAPEWYTEHSIELLAGKRVVKLDPTAQTITLHEGTILQYKKLLLAVGGHSRIYPVQGLAAEDTFYLHSLDDAKALIKKIKTAKRALIIGGGFISFEMCDLLRTSGVSVNLVIRGNYFWGHVMDKTGSQIVEQALQKNGVMIHKTSIVVSVEKNGQEKIARLNDGSRVPFDFIIIGIGLECGQGWIQEAGIEVNQGILANEYLETNLSSIWTAGDSAEFHDPILNEHVILGNWVNAQLQGRHAGRAMSTSVRNSFALVSSYTTSGLGLRIAFVGDPREAGFVRGVFG